MASNDFECKLCKKVISKGLFTSSGSFHKYKCPKHGDICEKHIKKHLFGSPTCKECGNKVRVYTKTEAKWVQDK